MKKLFLLCYCFIYVSFFSKLFAIIRLPPVMSSNMVLQQNSQATLWGWSDPSERFTITCSWKTTVDSVQAPNSGKWKAKISTPSAGGPYTITIKSRINTIVLENILIGEVWICSGQSNMEMSNTQHIKEEGTKSNNDKIRFFTVAKKTAEYPQDHAEGQWVSCNEETLRRFSAAGYFFGKKLHQELNNVPIGLIQSAWSGTPVELWEPVEVLNSDPAMKEAATKIRNVTYRPNTPGLIYNAMIYPISNYTIAGVIWYQGEGNTARASTYEKMFTGMIGAWRKQFEQDFPFYYVQIAPYTYEYTFEGALLMEQQTRSLSYPKTGMVVITDLVDNVKDQHPKNKLDVGLRLANIALAETYKQNIPAPVYLNPKFKRMDASKAKINLYFDNAPNGFMVKGDGTPTEFLIAGTDQNFLPAEVKIEKDRIVVSNKRISNPVAVRFSFSNTGMSNVFNKEGLPLIPFRTDNWEVVPAKQ
ncbi:MAG: sialate O-acetylesterase [Bacteroidetes bacterium]|nr:MAG: sialate O-acetylesterase [Bacteroidota bacterium]